MDSMKLRKLCVRCHLVYAISLKEAGTRTVEDLVILTKGFRAFLNSSSKY
jgi:hypothetical protein